MKNSISYRVNAQAISFYTELTYLGVDSCTFKINYRTHSLLRSMKVPTASICLHTQNDICNISSNADEYQEVQIFSREMKFIATSLILAIF